MNPAVPKMLRRVRRPVAAALIALLTLGPAHAAPPAISTAFQPVFIDGTVAAVASGEAFNVIFDGSAFHLWYRTGSPFDVTNIRYATSTDAVNYTTVGGAFSFSVNPFPTGTPPALYYDAVSVVGGSYKIIHWTSNGDEGTYPAYNTNNSVSDAGATASNTVLTHQGAITGGTPGLTIGALGIEAGRWFGVCGTAAQEICSSAYTDASPPSTVSPITSVINAGPLFTSEGIPTGYISNHGDIRPGGVGLEAAFTLRADTSGTRHNQQVYFSESSDGGLTFSTPVGLLSGPPTLSTGAFGPLPGSNFSHPELLRVPAGNILYVSTTNAAGASIIAVSGFPIAGPAAEVPVPTLGAGGIAALLGLLSLLAVPALRRRRSTTR